MTDLQKQKLKRVPKTSMLLAYFKADDLPKVYGGNCECEGGCVLGRAGYNVSQRSAIHCRNHLH